MAQPTLMKKMPPTVLLVDDDCSVRQLVGAILQSDGFSVISAQDGIAALDLSRKYPHNIDALVTDVEMPRMDGITLSPILAKERPGIACVIMSGQFPEGDLPLDSAFSPSRLRRMC